MLDVATLFGNPDSQLKVQTDVPVRCALLFTTTAPSPSRRFVKTRGVWKQHGTTWSINGGSWYWQNENGDTTEHTWTISGWSPGLALWYCVAAEQQGVPTVSRSILLNSVRPDPGSIKPSGDGTSTRLATISGPNPSSPNEPRPAIG